MLDPACGVLFRKEMKKRKKMKVEEDADEDKEKGGVKRFELPHFAAGC